MRCSRSSARSRRSSSRSRSTKRISTSPRTPGASRSATTVAQRLKERIREATGLTASAGVAPNKFLAKIASGWKKPDGLTVIAPERVEPFLQQLPVDALWGVGPVTAEKLRARGIERLVDVRTADPAACCATPSAAWPTGCGSSPHGVDDRPVEPNRATKSSGSENTYPEDLTDSRPDPRRRSTRWRATSPAGSRARQLLGAHGDDQGPLRRLHDHHAQPLRTPPTRDADEIATRAVALLDKTEAGAPAGPAARRQRAQPRRIRRNRACAPTVLCCRSERPGVRRLRRLVPSSAGRGDAPVSFPLEASRRLQPSAYGDDGSEAPLRKRPAAALLRPRSHRHR